MEEARAVLARLERIEALEREGAALLLVLAELRELVREVELWARTESRGLVRIDASAPSREGGYPARSPEGMSAA
jgi:transposase